MIRTRTTALILLGCLALSLAACGARKDPTLGGLSADEASAMNDAAVMLDRNSVVPIGNDSEDNQP